MSTSKFKSGAYAICLLVIAMVVPSLASAGGGGGMTGGSTELTQVMNNFQLLKVSADSALTASTTVQQYMNQLKQYELQILNSAGIDPRVLEANIRDAKNAYDTLNNYKNSVERLRGSLSAEAKAYDQRFIEAKLLKLNWSDYLKKVEKDALNGNESAKLRLQREADLMRQVEDDYSYVRQSQSDIKGAAGQHESLKILNGQMNRVIDQNARMISVMASTQTASKVEDAEAKNKALREAQQHDGLIQRNRDLRARQLEQFGATE